MNRTVVFPGSVSSVYRTLLATESVRSLNVGTLRSTELPAVRSWVPCEPGGAMRYHIPEWSYLTWWRNLDGDLVTRVVNELFVLCIYFTGCKRFTGCAFQRCSSCWLGIKIIYAGNNAGAGDLCIGILLWKDVINFHRFVIENSRHRNVIYLCISYHRTSWFVWVLLAPSVYSTQIFDPDFIQRKGMRGMFPVLFTPSDGLC